jgi:acetylornithine/N-succinyldiaminopimelate aminotransferase
MTDQSALLSLAQTNLYPNYQRPPFVLCRGQGVQLWDVEGRRYLDLCAGIAVNLLGHSHPRLVKAIADQAAQLIHVSNYFFNEPNILLAARLTGLSGYSRAFFCNSGTEAVEMSLKLARRHFTAKADPDRYRIIAFENSFHGRTLGALAATGQMKYRGGFGPLGGVTHVPFGDVEAVRASMGTDVAGIIFEPIQGEGGVLPAPDGFLHALRQIADTAGALLIADEVQSGVGRTGRFLACEHHGIVPDIVVLAKGLGGGFPIGAVLTTEHLAASMPPGSHGTTFGGNALASRAALTVLDVLVEEDLIKAAETKGALLGEMLHGLVQRHPKCVRQARGMGLLWALECDPNVDVGQILEKCQDAGLLLTRAGACALRFSPALTILPAELEEGVQRLDEVLKAFPICATC